MSTIERLGVVDMDHQRTHATHWTNLLRIDAFRAPQIPASAPAEIHRAAAFLHLVDTGIPNSVRIACLLLARVEAEGLPGGRKAAGLPHSGAPT